MKIAVYHNLPSGGAKRALQAMVCGLAVTHTVDIYTLSSADHDFCDLRYACREHMVFPFRPLPLAHSPFGRLNQGIRAVDMMRLRVLQRRIAEKIDAGAYDVVFVHHCRYTQAPSLLEFVKTPSVYYCQEPPRLVYEAPVSRPYTQFSRLQRLGNYLDPFPWLYTTTLKRLDLAGVRAASTVLVNSAYSRETFYHIYGSFARICYLGVDTRRFRPLGLPRGRFVLSVGQLGPRKGFDFVLQSLALIHVDVRPSLVVTCNAADPRERRYLETLAEQLGVLISFRERVADDELIRLYNQACLTIYTPVMEPFGFVPIESMACGTPVVGVREGGVRESIIHDKTGLLVDRDPDQFAEAISGLLQDKGRLAHFATCSIEHARQQWDWGRTISDLDQYLAHAAQGICS